MPAIHMPVCIMFSNYRVKRSYYKFKENQTPKIPQHRLLGEQDGQFDLRHWHSTPSQIMALQWISNCYHTLRETTDKPTLYNQSQLYMFKTTQKKI